jgi:8-oxo-dGTP pyrophosphatase MutT (NUDIX family)
MWSIGHEAMGEMMTNFLARLQHRLQHPLPGLDAQMRMAPPIRGRNPKIPADVRHSAVLILLYLHEDRWYLPFMRRAEDGRVHGGQVSFPGGRHEPEDPDFTYTALREAQEEIGLPPEQVEVLGPLTELYIPPSNFMVYPRLGVMSKRPDFVPDAREVAEIIEVEVEELRQEHIRGIHQVDVFGGNLIEAPGYTVHGKHLIWGGTAMMIAEVLALIDELPKF